MRINILTTFPAMFTGPLTESMMKRAVEAGLVSFNIINLRDFAQDRHHTTDQPPYGGGAGLVMMVEPIDKALATLPNSHKILMAAKGKQYNQHKARELAEMDEITLICGHYEGVDERVAEHLVDEEIRVGDYVLTGGEIPAMLIADSVVRLIPGVLGDSESLNHESHNEEGYLEYPQYTRPAEYKGWKVPEVLLGGNHNKIEKWRESMASSIKSEK